MNKLIIFPILMSAFSLAQEAQKTHHVKKSKSKTHLTNVKVVNALDPICQMENSKFLKDTVVYKSKVYGFCSSYCAKEFKKNPTKYVKKP